MGILEILREVSVELIIQNKDKEPLKKYWKQRVQWIDEMIEAEEEIEKNREALKH